MNPSSFPNENCRRIVRDVCERADLTRFGYPRETVGMYALGYFRGALSQLCSSPDKPTSDFAWRLSRDLQRPDAVDRVREIIDQVLGHE